MTRERHDLAWKVRDAVQGEVGPLARIWYDGWQDAHAGILPAELARFRTLASFEERLGSHLSTVRAVGAIAEPLGFCMTKGDELYQMYVSARARGTGAAAALILDAEARIAEGGARLAWLACAIGNERAARFYEKHGWRRVGVVVSELDTPEGIFPLRVWRYEKDLGTRA